MENKSIVNSTRSLENQQNVLHDEDVLHCLQGLQQTAVLLVNLLDHLHGVAEQLAQHVAHRLNHYLYLLHRFQIALLRVLEVVSLQCSQFHPEPLDEVVIYLQKVLLNLIYFEKLLEFVQKLVHFRY